MMTIDPATLASLADFPADFEAHFRAIPPGRTTWEPASWDGVPSEPLSALAQACHLRDIEVDGYQVRFRRTLAESTPDLASLDGEALAHERSYASADADEVFRRFRAARRETLAILGRVRAEDWSRTARFDGEMTTLRGLVHLLCSHDQQHLAGLQWLRAKMEGDLHVSSGGH